MIRAMLWKEFREQGLIAAMLLVLGSGVLVAAAMFGDPPVSGKSVTPLQLLGTGGMAALMLAVTAGMVCGGALFAAEREAGTIGFLESLPASRWEVWRAKLLAGTILAVVQVSVVLLVAALLGVAPREFAVRVAIYAALAFVWGVFGSTLSRTTLGSVGIAIPAAILAMFVFLIPILLFFTNPGTSAPRPEGELIFLSLMLGVPLVLSALAFTKSDRDREADDVIRWAATGDGPARRARVIPPSTRPVTDGAYAAPRHRGGLRLGVKALLWMSVRQLLGLGFVLSLFAVVFGLMMLAPGAKPILMWPSLTLAAGVLAGATVFADEQASQNARFWGDWRLPAGRMWAVKVGVHLAFALWLVVLIALPLAVRAQFTPSSHFTRGQSFLSGVFGTRLLEELDRQSWKVLFMPAAYGFAAGHLCGMLFKKVVVAVGVAALVGGTAAALWLPSLLSGGVWHWQIWLPPAAALVVARLLVRAWASNRLATRGPLFTLGGGVAAVFLLLGAGIGYRVLEVPDNPRGEDDVAFIAALPLSDHNVAGQGFRSAAERYSRFEVEAARAYNAAAGQGALRRPSAEELLERFVVLGHIPPNPAPLWAYLDQLHSDKGDGETVSWMELVAKAADRPLGIYEDPRLIGTTPSLVALENARRMSIGLMARGLQKQAAGEPAEFVKSLGGVLALARTVRNNSVVAAVNMANTIERGTLLAPLERWLENLGDDRPDLLRDALNVLMQGDPSEPFDPTPHLLAERHVLRELMKAPAQWVPDLVAGAKGKEDHDVEGDLVGFAWTVPWERERTRRLVGLGFEGQGGAIHYPLVRGRPGRGLLVGRLLNGSEMVEYDRQVRAIRRAAVARVALRLYQAEKGVLPPSLADLVAAGVLREVPRDPYRDQPLRYRISPGEKLGLPASDVRPSGRDTSVFHELQKGQGVVWSVGPNGTDEGGRQLPHTSTPALRIDDLVFPVPVGARSK